MYLVHNYIKIHLANALYADDMSKKSRIHILVKIFAQSLKIPLLYYHMNDNIHHTIWRNSNHKAPTRM